MPAAIAIPLALAAGSAVSGVVAAKMQSGAAKDAAGLQTDAANHAADLQSKATADALTFQKQQAENDWQNSQNVQRANYDQSKARYGSIAGVASQYGLNLGGMPDYAPGIDPHYDTGATPTPPAGSVAAAGPTAAPTGNLTDPNAWMSLVGDTPKLTQWVQGNLGPQADPSLVNYYVGKIKGQPGANPTEQAGSAAYWSQKIQADPSLGGSTAKPGTIAGASSSMSPTTIGAPAVNTAIPTPYQPGTIAGLARRY